jgi:hypothetical protein
MVPHVAARKTHQRLSEFSFATPKRLLQQYPLKNGRRQALGKFYSVADVSDAIPYPANRQIGWQAHLGGQEAILIGVGECLVEPLRGELWRSVLE